NIHYLESGKNIHLVRGNEKRKPGLKISGVFKIVLQKLDTLKKRHWVPLKHRLPKMRLRVKWMLSTLIFIILSCLILVSLFIKSGEKNLKVELEKWGLSLSSNLVHNAQYAILLKDYETLQNYLNGIMTENEIFYSVILDESGSYLAVRDPKWLFNSELNNLSMKVMEKECFTRTLSDGSPYYHLVNSIQIEKEEYINDEHILFDRIEPVIDNSGNLQFKLTSPLMTKKSIRVIFGISHERMNAKLKDMRNNAITIATIIALISISFVFLGVQRITAPIQRLVKATREVALGDLTQLVETDRRDELGELSKSFNEMTTELKESRGLHLSYTENLATQVSVRTRLLKESEEKYRTLFEHSGTAVIMFGMDDKILMTNKRFEELSGCPKKDVERNTAFSSFFIREDQRKIKEYIYRTDGIRGIQTPVSYECNFLERAGQVKNVNLTMTLIPDKKNILASITDVTELKELQKKFIRSEQLAQIGQLSAAIAHEIRNPLGAINTSVGILKQGLDLSGEDQELLEIIGEETMRLNKIIEDFLQFANPKKLRIKETDINVLIRDLFRLFKDKFGNGIQKKLNLAPNLPLLQVDPNQVKQVMINILLNAIDAMPSGGILDTFTRQTLNRSGRQCIEIIFKDSGSGIDDFHLSKIFQPFYSTKEKGAGMGLAICERIIHNHGGEINVVSEPGKGSQFIISLPTKAS
ncbi:MAG TPA: ATP-binding protein, partial [bacterium]